MAKIIMVAKKTVFSLLLVDRETKGHHSQVLKFSSLLEYLRPSENRFMTHNQKSRSFTYRPCRLHHRLKPLQTKLKNKKGRGCALRRYGFYFSSIMSSGYARVLCSAMSSPQSSASRPTRNRLAFFSKVNIISPIARAHSAIAPAPIACTQI